MSHASCSEPPSVRQPRQRPALAESPNRSLGNVTPLSLLDTDLGAEAVTDTLGRIEHGVYT
ncbi:MAG: DUF2384 domain-containing protein [Betaproteobacteria bacterium]|nr:DUF2384 domain-containing protein [Betaproteobacteria bacterium]